MEVLKYLQAHPMTFHTTSRKLALKPQEGLKYPGGYMLSFRWNHYYLTYKGACYTVPFETFRWLASHEDVKKQVGIFTFHAGFEQSKEGKLLQRTHRPEYVNDVIMKTKALFNAGLVETYVTEWWRVLCTEHS